MKIVNLTGHDITIVKQEWNLLLPRIEGVKIHLQVVVEQVGKVLHTESKQNIPLFTYKYHLSDAIINSIAPKKWWVIYVVSRIVAEYTKREDFYVTGQHYKADGKVIWTKGLQKNPFIS